MATTPSTPALLDRLPSLTLRDEHRLRRRLEQGREPLERLAAEVGRAEQRIARRLANRPTITYPPELPVSQAKDALAEAIAGHQVVVVAGETGSGKTTQLPKICLELGRGIRGTIGHSQPRRLAARTVADRIAEELGTDLGTTVGFKVRFADRSNDDTLVKLMTDGVLLAEIQSDRELRQYDTLIIDEAHERSLNVDFLLGYLKRLLPRRPDLKVIVTSATIETERFSAHFGGAPVMTVSGRTYPVEVRYRPPDEDTDPVQAVVDAVREVRHEGPGDVLVFLSGEREIRDTADALRRLDLRDTEVLPLYARLSHAEQHRVFERSNGRRVVLATNVAETSLTVPGIRYVVDPGTARISRYSTRLKVQRLPIEAVSQASANQRKGRCGRVAEGICVRLYSEEDFLARPEYTDPEIQRTNLASVVLRMAALGLGQVEEFPFVDPPDRRAVRDGVALLHELGALEEGRGEPRLTPLGRRLAQLPLDPRFGRMVLEADGNGCLREVLVIAAALTVQDPRERPADKQQAADAMHARFADPASDFLAYLKLWDHLQERQDALSSSAFRRLCKAEFLHYLRVREWQDLHGQLARIAADLGLHEAATPADGRRVHGALLAGLLSHVGLKEADRNEYLGARGAKFAVFPGSALFKKPPRWVVAAELVETSRLWGRICARIEPEWVEPLAGHLVVRRYSEPRWSRKRGSVVATERVTLYGIPLVTGRTVDYGRIDPAVSRELFIRSALVEGDWETHHAFFAANRALLADVEDLEHRARRRDLVVEDQALHDFYDARIPADVVSARHFDAWWKQARRATPDLLTFPRDLVLRAGVDLGEFPGEWVQGDLHLPLTYRFDPGDPADGVTVEVPLAVLPRVDGDDLTWQVAGLRLDLVTALLRSLPKPLRVGLVPVPDTAAAVLRRVVPRSGPLLDVLADELRRMTGVVVPYDAWDWSRVPPHLRMTVRVVDERGREVAAGKDLEALRAKAWPAVLEALSSAATEVERRGLTAWTDVPRTFASGTVQGFPALVDEGATVGVRVLATEAEQRVAHRAGVRRLLLLGLGNPVRAVVGRLPKQVKLALPASPYPSVPALLDDCVVAALDSLVDEPPWTEAAFAELRDRVRPELADATFEVVVAAGEALAAARRVRDRAALPADVDRQLDRLVHEGFVAETGRQRLRDLPRYLQAVEVRLERLPRDPGRDRLNAQVVRQLEDEYDELLRGLPPARRHDEAVRHVRWMIEELRVQLFAPTMRTAFPVSEKRVLRAMDDLV
ncbi:MAG TPA: ATP-dependent RNA helicase HrpA [Mycobacteriales bacterium]|jgi:ATP-dependent helicase HrpA|nr:ATP-dependent RNA helicase HrpA [Mycobacteriales bacterium]